ncbi:YjhX family toxin [Roseinatronobacter alkalisoli]|uniref:YjhX family toxin n=1 Tax=Roseinatronobacter alkalisoli TaxID=3028235 RepID=A0ABT5TBE8_9RHOB|nr:YjhX family toxin [Roseinatronobacter sp. HJB301]MDD7972274.1 YjhX family toxin [Roseinatronobacter sp. HJB301]
MNISKLEQRVLHVLAQGGLIRYTRGPNGKLIETDCFTHDGSVLVNCTPRMVSALRRKRLIESRNASPYRISQLGRRLVKSQLDNRTS